MSSALIESKPARESYIAFSVTEETVKPMAEKYLALKISGIDDKAGIAIVTAARSEARTARTTVEEERKAAKKYYLEYGRKIDAAAEHVVSKIEKIESHLVGILEWVKAENQRIQDERLKQRLAERMDALDEVGGIPSVVAKQFNQELVRVMTDDRFAEFVIEMADLNNRLMAEAKANREDEERRRNETARMEEERAERDKLHKAELDQKRIEQDRIDAEREVEHKANQERLAEERRQLDAQRAEQKKEADRLEAERKRISDAEIEKAQAIEVERLAEERLKQAERDRIEKDRLAIEEQTRRIEALPHRERIADYRDKLLAVGWPHLPTKYAGAEESIRELRQDIKDRLNQLASGVK